MSDDGSAETGEEMVGAEFRQMLQSIDTAVALVEAQTWTVKFENACFFKWFPVDADVDDDTLPGRIDNFLPDRATSR